MTKSADPDQLASEEATWSGSTLFAKTGHIVSSKRRLGSFSVDQLTYLHFCYYCFSDESGSDSDGADSTSSSYSSLSDFVTDMVNSEIDGDTPCKYSIALDKVLFIPRHTKFSSFCSSIGLFIQWNLC